MKDRLLKIITSEGLTSALLADEMGVQRSGISHILSGRNNPGFDFLQKLLTRFPKLNAEWLILGQGSMYKANDTEIPSLFATKEPQQKTSLSPTLPEKPQISASGEGEKKEPSKAQPEISPPTESQKEIEKIIILYRDKTFSSYFPEL